MGNIFYFSWTYCGTLLHDGCEKVITFEPALRGRFIGITIRGGKIVHAYKTKKFTCPDCGKISNFIYLDDDGEANKQIEAQNEIMIAQGSLLCHSLDL